MKRKKNLKKKRKNLKRRGTGQPYKERDNRVLMKMNSLKRIISSQDVSSSDSEKDPNFENNDLTVTDNFTDEDLVSHCTDILQVPTWSTVGGGGGQRPRNLSGPQKTPLQTFGCHIQDEGEPMTQPTSTNHSHPQPSFGGKKPNQGLVIYTVTKVAYMYQDLSRCHGQ